MMVSVSWRSTLSTGLRELIGSWKIIEISVPRTPSSAFSFSDSRLRSPYQTSPSVTSPGGSGTRPITESALTLFPDPDSPTMASVSPSWSVYVTPSTAGSAPALVLKTVVRSETRSSSFGIALNPCAAGDPAPRGSRRRED